MAQTQVTNKCQEEGCDWEGTPCFLPDNPVYGLSEEDVETGKADEAEPDAYYCSKHAQKAGFCFGCGAFWGGVESFDFSYGPFAGLCEICKSSGEFEDEDEDDEDMDGVYTNYPFDQEEDWGQEE